MDPSAPALEQPGAWSEFERAESGVESELESAAFAASVHKPEAPESPHQEQESAPAPMWVEE